MRIVRRAALGPLWRTALLYGLVFLAGLLIVGGAFYRVATRSLIDDIDARLSTESRAILGSGTATPFAVVRRRLAERKWHDIDDDLAYALFDPAGRMLGGTARLRLPRRGYSDIDYIEANGHPDHGRALAVRRSDGVVLALIADYGPVEVLNAKLGQVAATMLVITIAIGWGAGVAMTVSIGRRIEANTRTATSIIAGDIARRMPLDGSGGAFDRQATVLNTMLDRVETLRDELRRLSSDVAHDLRSPLAKLRNQLLAIATRSPDHPDIADVEVALDQSERVLALFSAILRISEVENGSRRRMIAPVDLSRLTAEIAELLGPVADAAQKTIAARATDGVCVEGDRELLAQALINLAENSLKYSEAGTSIVLSACMRADDVMLSVADDGPGIAPDDRATALRRFGRLDRSRSKPGNGLGLSLVTSIARAHGGTLALEDAAPGLIARLSLPKQAS